MAQKNTNFYDLLKVPQTASVHEINQAYRKLAREFHPDKNPSAGDIFKEISYAHEVLTDQSKRLLYDRYGIEGLQGGIRRESPVNIHNLFPHFPGGSFFGINPGMGLFTSYPPHQRRVEDTMYFIKVTLEGLYHGQTIKYNIKRNIVCAACTGKGARSGLRQLCHKCLGTGHTIGSSILPVPITCFECGGAGSIIPEHDRCIYCVGATVRSENVIVDVLVERGMKNNERIVLYGQGDQAPGAEAGNIVFVLQEQPHQIYQRHDNDLYVSKDIELSEALCGFTFALPYLNGKILKIVQPVGESIVHGKIKGLLNKGMPLRGHLARRGNLYVRFNVKFPPNYFANRTQLEILEKVLGPRPEFIMPTGDDTEEVDLLDYEPEDYSFANIDLEQEDMHDDPHICAPQ